MPSVREIAKQAGVSITTVSRVLNNHPNVSVDVRELVLAAANRSRYVANVGRRSTNNIAFVYTGDRSLGSPFDAGLLQGIGDALDDFEYDLMVLETRRARKADESYSNMFMRKGIRGAILRATAQSRGICEAIAAEGFPVVVIGERFAPKTVPHIYTDSRATSREAIDYLIGAGHRRIGICINTVEDSDHRDRLAGYRESVESHGLGFDEKLVWRVPANREGGPQVIKRVLSMSERPTAVYITDPLTCVGALAEARRAALAVPQDLSIVGFDDGDLRKCVTPALTAVCQDATALGRAALLMLDRYMNEGLASLDGLAVPRCWLEIHDTTTSVIETAGTVPAPAEAAA
jgi:DNA-binding LacI/PurR family transcriptional regulator